MFIVWKTKINMRQKIVLSCVFLLVSFTVAVTIVRGSFFGGAYFDIVWVGFWIYVEFFVCKFSLSFLFFFVL